ASPHTTAVHTPDVPSPPRVSGASVVRPDQRASSTPVTGDATERAAVDRSTGCLFSSRTTPATCTCVPDGASLTMTTRVPSGETETLTTLRPASHSGARVTSSPVPRTRSSPAPPLVQVAPYRSTDGAARSGPSKSSTAPSGVRLTIRSSPSRTAIGPPAGLTANAVGSATADRSDVVSYVSSVL